MSIELHDLRWDVHTEGIRYLCRGTKRFMTEPEEGAQGASEGRQSRKASWETTGERTTGLAGQGWKLTRSSSWSPFGDLWQGPMSETVRIPHMDEPDFLSSHTHPLHLNYSTCLEKHRIPKQNAEDLSAEYKCTNVVDALPMWSQTRTALKEWILFCGGEGSSMFVSSYSRELQFHSHKPFS